MKNSRFCRAFSVSLYAYRIRGRSDDEALWPEPRLNISSGYDNGWLSYGCVTFGLRREREGKGGGERD